MAYTFTTIVRADGKTATGLAVPVEAVDALGAGKRPKVKVIINGYTYRNTIQGYNGEILLSLSAENRQSAGVQAGDQVQVTLELDTEPRLVEIPEDLGNALLNKPGILDAFNRLSYSSRKEFVRQVEEARTRETRERRILGIVGKMVAV